MVANVVPIRLPALSMAVSEPVSSAMLKRHNIPSTKVVTKAAPWILAVC